MILYNIDKKLGMMSAKTTPKQAQTQAGKPTAATRPMSARTRSGMPSRGLTKHVRSMRRFFLQPSFVLSIVFVVLAGFILYLSSKIDAIGPSMTFLMISLTACGVGVAFEVISRRRWEAGLSSYFRFLEDRIEFLLDENQQLNENIHRIKLALSNMIDHQVTPGKKGQKALSEIMRDLHVGLGEASSGNENISTNEKSTLAQMIQSKNGTDSDNDFDLPDFDTVDEDDISDDIIIGYGESLERAKKNPTTLSALSNTGPTHKTIADAVKQDHVDIFLQPVVNLPQRNVFFYEILGRVKQARDVHLKAGQFLDVVRASKLIPSIDSLVFMRAIQMIRNQKPALKTVDNKDVSYFINLHLESLENRVFMNDIADYLDNNRFIANRLVFEFTQDDYAQIDHAMWLQLRKLAQFGCRFSMDGVTKLDLNVDELVVNSVQFVKIDAAFLVDTLSSRIGQSAFHTLKKDLDRNGIDLIVQKIEDEEDVLAIMDYDIHYGQGFLLGQPNLYKLALAA